MRSPFLLLAACTLTTGCFVYGEDLISEDPSAATGGSTGDSGADDGPGTGGTPGDGGTGGAQSGGGDPSGGSDSGGTGGSDGGSGGTGTGGDSSEGFLVDDLSQGNVYANGIGTDHAFFGQWYQVDDNSPGGSWDSTTVAGMVQEREAGNDAMHVKASGYSDWGIDAYLTLQDSGSPGPKDLSAYSKMTFWAKSDGATKIISVKFEDAVSHSPGCEVTNCYVHAPAVPNKNLTTEWKKYEIDISGVVRSPAFDETTAYAIHFSMDAAEVDFWIDDIYFFE